MLFDTLKNPGNDYASLDLPENPFKIAPLFRNFHEKKSCEFHEKLLVIPKEFEKHMRILAGIKDRRVLVYGCFGVGKTSIVDCLLYTGC